MAGDWIKMEKNTPRKPEMFAIANLLSASRGDVFLGCFNLWCWADDNTADGNVRSVTTDVVDDISGLKGLGDALLKVGWLHARSGSLELPNFGRHMSESAKNRALTALRVEKSRRHKCNGESVTESLPEKRREENKTPLTPQGGKAVRKRAPPKPLPELPESLATSAMRSAWDKWLAYRRELHKPVTPTGAAQALKEFAQWGERRAVAAIEYTILKGWQGLREPDDSRSAPPEEIDPDEAERQRRAYDLKAQAEEMRRRDEERAREAANKGTKP